MSNPYKVKSGYFPNPSNPLYESDTEISDAPEIQELIELATDLEEKISGDFNLDSLTFQLRNDSLSYVRQGLILFKIKSMRLYSKVCKTFKEFCQTYARYSVWYCNRLIVSAKVVMELVCNNFELLPKCEAQARSLLYASEGDIVRGWRSVVEEIKPHEITANSIRQHLKPKEEKDEPVKEKIEVDRPLYKSILSVALGVNLSVVQLLEELFQPIRNCDNWQSDPAGICSAARIIEKLHNDIEELVKQHENST